MFEVNTSTMSYFASMRSKMGDLKDKLSDRQKKAGLLAGDDEKARPL